MPNELSAILAEAARYLTADETAKRESGLIAQAARHARDSTRDRLQRDGRWSAARAAIVAAEVAIENQRAIREGGPRALMVGADGRLHRPSADNSARAVCGELLAFRYSSTDPFIRDRCDDCWPGP